MMGIETCETACVPATEAGSLTAVPPTCAFLAACACLGETREAGAMILFFITAKRLPLFSGMDTHLLTLRADN